MWNNDASFNNGSGIANLEFGSVTSVKSDYKFSVWMNNGSFTINSGATTKLVFDQKEFDTSSNYSTSTGLFTAPITGYYVFMAGAALGTAGLNDGSTTAIYINNGTISREGVRQAVGSTGAVPLNVVNTIMSLTSGTAVEVDYYNGDATSRIINAGQGVCYFQGFLLSTT